MAFKREVTIAPVSIGAIEVVLISADPLSTEQSGVRYSVQVKMSDGSMVVRTGDLVQHLTQAQQDNLLSFMANLRTKAEAEFLP